MGIVREGKEGSKEGRWRRGEKEAVCMCVVSYLQKLCRRVLVGCVGGHRKMGRR